MQSWSVPCSAPGKGSDTLRVTLSIRNTGLALWGVQMQHRDPRSRRAMPPSQAVRSTGTILGRGLFFQAQVTVTLQLTLLFLCAAGTVSVCLSIHGSGFQQDSTGTQGGGCSPRWPWGLVFRWPGRVGDVCCPEWLSSHQPRSAAGGWGASAAGACCGRQ